MPIQPPPCVPASLLTFACSRKQLLLQGDRRDHDSRDRVLLRVRDQFCEMPWMRLTDAQSARLLGFQTAVCVRVLETLVREGMLWKGADGRYGVRARG